MARIRTIKPEFWQDEKLAPLDPLTRLVFLGLISQADDAGRLVDSVRLLDGLLFPMTDDTCADALVKLNELGVIERGVTASGQRVIQIVGWEKHQKVEKPNLKSALGPIAVSDTSAKRRRTIPPALRLAIIERDGGVCRECGVQVKVHKDDRYDSDPTLAEIDHIVPVADGGTDDPENLRLLCLACNRKKAGEDARRRNAETSGMLPRNVGESSPTHTYDLRPTIDDLRSGTNENDQHPKAEEASRQPPAHTREPAAPPADAAAHTEHVNAMRQVVAEAAERIQKPADRRRLEAELELIVTGDDVAAWRDTRGDPVPWEDRPRLLRLALRRWELDRQKYPKPRSALLYVVAQQYDPFERPTGMSAKEEAEHYDRHRDSANWRRDGEPKPIGGIVGIEGRKPAELDPEAQRAQEWAREHADRFQQILDRIAETESLDLNNALHRVRAVGLALKRVRDEILTPERERGVA